MFSIVTLPVRCILLLTKPPLDLLACLAVCERVREHKRTGELLQNLLLGVSMYLLPSYISALASVVLKKI